jgi:bis(5'-nucleosyl)-tetraphosphatase (symmetrical)
MKKTYAIGDIQGCQPRMDELLERIRETSPDADFIFVGDLVNRGPRSLAVVRRMMALHGAAEGLLGNHDLHLLAVSQGVRPQGRWDTIADILEAPDRDALLDWLRERPMALRERGVLMVHAGVLPQWSADQALALAHEVEGVLRSTDWTAFVHQMYGDEPSAWRDDLPHTDRLRVVVNALTRLRFCTPEGRMEFKTKVGNAAAAPPGYLPWFDVPGRKTANQWIAFGHWSTLGPVERSDVLPLDTGCVWGGALTALRLGTNADDRERIQVRCPRAQALR